MKYAVLFIVFSSFFYGCSNKNQIIQEDTIFLSEEIGAFNYSDLFDRCDITPLALPDNYLIGKIDKIIKKDSLLFILDSQYDKSISIFNSSGASYGRFKNFGPGPLEYIDIIDFDVDDDRIIVLCVPYKLLIVNKKDMKVAQEVLLDSFYDRVILKKTDTVLLYSHSNYVVDLLDLKTNELQNILKKDPLKGVYMYPKQVFFRCLNNLYFQATSDDIIHSISEENKFSPFVMLDYEKKAVVKNFFQNKKDAVRKVSDIWDYPLINITHMFEYNNAIGFIYSFGGRFRINYVTKKSERVDYYIKADINLVNNCYFDTDKIVTWDYLFEINRNGFSHTEEIEDWGILEDDTPVILEYYFK